MLYMIACVGPNNELGYKGRLIYTIPKDMERFKKITKGSIVIMGRKTYKSIGKPLKGRTNVVMSKTLDRLKVHRDVTIFCDIEDTIRFAEDRSRYYNIGIIGGSEIYNHFLPHVKKVFLTKVSAPVKEADSFFPLGLDDPRIWHAVSEKIQSVYLRDHQGSNIKGTMEFLTYTRRNGYGLK